MKKTLKRTLSILVIVTFIFACLTPSAYTVTDNSILTGLSTPKSDTTPSKLFIEMCDKFFASGSTYKAFDKEGKDVTYSFKSENLEYYEKGEYTTIMDRFLNELKYFNYSEEQEAILFRVPSKTITEYFYVLDQTTGHVGDTTFEMLYSISGWYSYNPVTGIIIDYSPPTFNIEAFTIGQLYTYSIHNISTYSILAHDASYIDFHASFTLKVSWVPYQGVVMWTQSFMYSDFARGYPTP